MHFCKTVGIEHIEACQFSRLPLIFSRVMVLREPGQTLCSDLIRHFRNQLCQKYLRNTMALKNIWLLLVPVFLGSKPPQKALAPISQLPNRGPKKKSYTLPTPLERKSP